jgi:hypothetical protein
MVSHDWLQAIEEQARLYDGITKRMAADLNSLYESVSLTDQFKFPQPPVFTAAQVAKEAHDSLMESMGWNLDWINNIGKSIDATIAQLGESTRTDFESGRDGIFTEIELREISNQAEGRLDEPKERNRELIGFELPNDER